MIKPIKIAFLGDSVTEGCFELYPCSYGFDTVRHPEDCYVTKTENALRQTYGEQAILCRNFGVSGLSAHAALPRTREAAKWEPNIAVVCFGLNDSLRGDDVFDKSLADVFSALSEVQAVVYLSPNMMNTYVHPDTLPEALKVAQKAMEVQTNGRFDRLIHTAESLCEAYGYLFCDGYAYWKSLYASGIDTTELLSNKINHPNAQMHSKTAELLVSFLEKRVLHDFL